MQNKRLEERLKKSGFLFCIPLLEMCEGDRNIKEIEVNHTGFTESKIINRMIETYLDTLNIKIKYVDMKKRTQELNINVPFYQKSTCKNKVHEPFKNSVPKHLRKKMYETYKYNMFSIDNDSYAVCPDCNDFVKL